MIDKSKIKRLDAALELRLDQLVQKAVHTDLTPEKRDERRRLAQDEFQFCKIYYPRIFDQPFNAVHRHIRSLSVGDYSISGARKIGKTAYTIVAKLIKRIAERKGGMANISLRTQENAKIRAFMIRNMIMNNELLVYDYDIRIQRDKIEHYIINDVHIMPSSYQTGLRYVINEDFKRFIFSLCDDLYSKDSVSSDIDNKRVADFFLSEVNGQMEDDGLSIITGNSISANCPIVQIKEQNPDNHFSLPALINGETCWPESSKHTTEYWNQIKASVPFDVWMGEYMDEPVQKGEVFDVNWIKTVNINTTKIIAALSAIDPATGESPHACKKGVATIGKTNKGKIEVIDFFIRHVGYEETFQHIHDLRQEVKNWRTLIFENDFNQWAGAKPYYDNWRKKTGFTIPIYKIEAKNLKTVYYGSDKTSRIMNLVYPNQSGELIYSDELFTILGQDNVKAHNQDAAEFLKEFISFGKNKSKLDGLDALATAYILINRYVASGSFDIVTSGSNYSNEEDAWLNNRYNW